MCKDGIWPPKDGSRQEDDPGFLSALGQCICAARVHRGAVDKDCALARPGRQELASGLLEGRVIIQHRKDDGALLYEICEINSSGAWRVAAIVSLCLI